MRVVVAGGVTLAVVALGICGALVLGGDHPDDVGVAASVAGVPDLPAVALDDQPSDGAGGTERLTEARTRLADAVEDGETAHAQAAARSATPSAALRSLRRALDAGRAALEIRPPNDRSSEARTVAYLKTLDTRRSAILDAVTGVADAGHAQPGPAAPWSTSGRGSGGAAPVGPAPDHGGASEGATGGSGGGSGSGGATGGGSAGDTTGSTGSTGGGTTTPPVAPPPSADPTSEPSTEPPVEPTPGPTPDSSASPTATPESAGP
ncbi:hypothetical protein GCM10023198_33700 [Promicromonospora umidemergens]|uniref:DUF5667 domain-containing protein n=1 Tax=Promicromonospora umidemergens TaxID=629679 RepID=A0ABP8XHR0_9MICO